MQPIVVLVVEVARPQLVGMSLEQTVVLVVPATMFPLSSVVQVFSRAVAAAAAVSLAVLVVLRLVVLVAVAQ
jgi:hypothetical protein